MIVTQRGVVDITPEYNRALRPIFCVSEGDKTSRQIVLTVMQSGETFLIPSGATVYIVGKKPDNNVFTYRCTYSGSDVTFSVTDQMSAVSGIVLCELQINLNGEVLGSANFVYWTEPTPLENGSYSESDLNIFLEAIAGAERLDNFYAGIEDMVAQAVEQIQIMPGQVVIDPTLRVSGAAADAAATGNAVRSFLEALVTETTPTAAIATCDDAAGGLPLRKLTAQIEPTQSGTGDPSPDNVRPISGYSSLTVTRAGKNLLPNTGAATTTSAEVTYTKHSDGSVTASGTATGTSTYRFVTAADRFTLKAGTYRISGITPSSDISITWRATDGTSGFWYDADNEFTLTADKTYEFIALRFQSGAVVSNVTAYPMIRPASITDATYEPYNGATYPVTFPTEAGTVYGGIVTVNSDGSGQLVVNRKRVNLSSEMKWTGTGTISAQNVRRYTNFADHAPATDGWTYTDIWCSHFVYENGNIGAWGTFNYTFAGNFSVKDMYGFIPTKQDFLDWLDAQITAGTPVQVVYPIVPVTYSLTAAQIVQMLNGVNNIWTDTAGTVSGEYYASTALYVQKIVNAQKGMIAGVEEAMTATQNYSVGDLMIVGDALYKATAAISSGAALTVGTNIAQTTVAEQLIALANA